MNRIYKIVWCSSKQIWKVCSEHSKNAKTKSAKSKADISTSTIKTIFKIAAPTLLLTSTCYSLAADYSQIKAENENKTYTGDTVLHTSDSNNQHAAYAINGTLTLNNSNITTTGTTRNYGLIAYSNGTITTSNTNVTTAGSISHAVQAGNKTGDIISSGTINLTGGTFTVNAGNGSSWATGLHSVYGGEINANGISIISKGTAILSESDSTVIVSNSTINTTGALIAITANNDNNSEGGFIRLNNSTITTTGNNGVAVFADKGGNIEMTNGNIITTSGSNAYGASSSNGGTIEITSGSITTNGKSAHGLKSTDEDSSITATNLDIKINGITDKTYGIQATNNSSITLNGGDIETDGLRGYGIMSEYGGHVNSSADITVNGASSHAVQAGGQGTNSAYTGSSAGTVTLTGGTLTVNADNGNSWGAGLHAVDFSEIIASNIRINSKSFAILSESESSINIKDSIINTTGNVTALSANNDRRKDARDANSLGGEITVNNTQITTTGNKAHGASAEWGGKLDITNSTISANGDNASALYALNSGTINVTGTSLISAKSSTIAVHFDHAGEQVDITLGSGTNATNNNGKLLYVTSKDDLSNDGIVNFILDNGSTSTGDIIEGRTSLFGNGGINVTLEENATWTGKLHGVKGFISKQKGTANFTDKFEIEGDLAGSNGSIFNFSDQGAVIGGNLEGTGTTFNFSKNSDTSPIINGDVKLTEGSKITGGSTENPIIAEKSVAVDSSSTLAGNWRIKGDLDNGGSLAPGNSIGSFIIDGNLTLQDTSVYDVEVDSTGNSDRAIVTKGTITLAGSILVSAIDDYKLNSPYTIIKAEPEGENTITITGDFTSVSFKKESAFLALSHEKHNDSVTITIDRNDTSFASLTNTSNQAAVANALDQKSFSVTNKISQLTAEEANSAFQELAGNTNASIKTGLISTANLTSDAINNRMRSTFDGVGSKQTAVLQFVHSETTLNHGFWASGFGTWVDQDGNANANGLETSTGGFLTGVDIGLASGWGIGLVTGYSKTDMDAKGHNASTTSDNWHLGAYTGNQWGALGVRAGLVYTDSSLEGKRAVNYADTTETLRSDYDAHSTQVFADVGYQIDLAPVVIEPFLNLSHVNLRTKGYSEKDGDAALVVSSKTTDTTFSTFGVRAAAPFAIGNASANFKGSLGWRHAYGDINPTSTQSIAGTSFAVKGVGIAEDTALLEAGLDFRINPSATVGISYVGQYGSGLTENGVNATFNYKF